MRRLSVLARRSASTLRDDMTTSSEIGASTLHFVISSDVLKALTLVPLNSAKIIALADNQEGRCISDRQWERWIIIEGGL